MEYSTDGAVAVITLDRPPLNALNAELIGELGEAVARAEDPSVRAVVVTGRRVFAAGADINRFVDAFDSGALEPQASGLGAVVRSLESLLKPVLAAVTGYALGGGLELAMGADFRYFGEGAKVGQPEIKLGLIPGAGGTQRLPRLVGYQRAKELVMSGRHIGADEALAIGLADVVVPDDDVLDAATEAAAKWAEGPTPAYAAAKRALTDARALPLDEALAFEQDRFNELFATADAKTGVLAFLNKETPEFD
ncbi:MAG: enoyl-CoA hydratase/isomerase family protein, partial [Actinobacteria bacterium]|nr:enoyl-CoA hydratase/isomerase family protein [Actinomycetota bacterium]NIW30047.1 enoyl-CoA hydratase/isomerase family protein [Actinomycetota bacterium]NIX22517.1 enoyl-CoA hydratase/isomerase family protein [Actinomycetota bacterium]